MSTLEKEAFGSVKPRFLNRVKNNKLEY